MTLDKNLLKQCREGERKAQEELFRLYSPLMLGICLRYAKNRVDAEDIMQEGFIKIFTHLHNFRGEGSFEGWMKRIMVNSALNHYYKAKKEQKHKNFDDIRETDIDVDYEEEAPKIRFSQQEMLEALQQLPAGYKQVFNLYVFEKYKHREIADILGISVNTSKSQLSKARVYLQKILIKLEKNRKDD